MRVYTIKDIENFEKDEYGRTIGLCQPGPLGRLGGWK